MLWGARVREWNVIYLRMVEEKIGIILCFIAVLPEREVVDLYLELVMLVGAVLQRISLNSKIPNYSLIAFPLTGILTSS